jgi:uncharacterized protein (DUF1697 family)
VIYVALLRGINVGGKNKIKMQTLKKIFEQAGMQKVKTYINSGDVVFQNEELSPEKITQKLELSILDTFQLEIKVLLKSLEDYHLIMDALPDSWTNDKEMRSDVLFLWEDIDHPNILVEIPFKPNIDTVDYVKGAILWSVDRKSLSKSGMSKLIGTSPYQKMTIRNVNTARKIHHLMK